MARQTAEGLDAARVSGSVSGRGELRAPIDSGARASFCAQAKLAATKAKVMAALKGVDVGVIKKLLLLAVATSIEFDIDRFDTCLTRRSASGLAASPSFTQLYGLSRVVH